MSDEADIDKHLVDEVLNYFRQHPWAADSVEGIARWRLLDERLLRHVEATERALRWLVNQGDLIEESRPGMTPLFRLAPPAKDEPKKRGPA